MPQAFDGRPGQPERAVGGVGFAECRDRQFVAVNRGRGWFGLGHTV